jgi:hypothetical protein
MQTLLEMKDLAGKTLPDISAYQLDILIEAEDITRDLMYIVAPDQKP